MLFPGFPYATTRYITTMYWAYTTMTTVGYGDIYGTTIAEKVGRPTAHLTSLPHDMNAHFPLGSARIVTVTGSSMQLSRLCPSSTLSIPCRCCTCTGHSITYLTLPLLNGSYGPTTSLCTNMHDMAVDSLQAAPLSSSLSASPYLTSDLECHHIPRHLSFCGWVYGSRYGVWLPWSLADSFFRSASAEWHLLSAAWTRTKWRAASDCTSCPPL